MICNRLLRIWNPDTPRPLFFISCVSLIIPACKGFDPLHVLVMVTHPSTNQARRCLTSVIWREPKIPTWYGRKRRLKACSPSLSASRRAIKKATEKSKECRPTLASHDDREESMMYDWGGTAVRTIHIQPSHEETTVEKTVTSSRWRTMEELYKRGHPQCTSATAETELLTSWWGHTPRT